MFRPLFLLRVSAKIYTPAPFLVKALVILKDPVSRKHHDRYPRDCSFWASGLPVLGKRRFLRRPRLSPYQRINGGDCGISLRICAAACTCFHLAGAIPLAPGPVLGRRRRGGWGARLDRLLLSSLCRTDGRCRTRLGGPDRRPPRPLQRPQPGTAGTPSAWWFCAGTAGHRPHLASRTRAGTAQRDRHGAPGWLLLWLLLYFDQPCEPQRDLLAVGNRALYIRTLLAGHGLLQEAASDTEAYICAADPAGRWAGRYW